VEERGELFDHQGMTDRSLEDQHQDVVRDGLRHEIEGTGAERLNRDVHAAEAGHRDDEQVRALGECGPAELDPVHAVHLDVGQHDLVLRLRDQPERLLGVAGARHGVRAAPERRFGHGAHLLVVVHHQHPGLLARARRRRLRACRVGS
jgi:hypothetical protein